MHVAPTLTDFLTAYPRLKMELTITDRLIDLAEEGYDMAIRVTAEPPLTLVARKLAPVRCKLCGTPAYFEKIGLPLIPADLVHHNCLNYTRSGEHGLWRFIGWGFVLGGTAWEWLSRSNSPSGALLR